jgi:hypothetical protein
MFQICVLDQKVQGKKQVLCFWNFFKMQWLGELKYTIFFILFSVQNIWNLINVCKKYYENVHLSVS